MTEKKGQTEDKNDQTLTKNTIPATPNSLTEVTLDKQGLGITSPDPIINTSVDLTGSRANTPKSRVNRKWLLVACDEYENPANNLNGCVNDQQDMYDLLISDGFPRTKIKVLTNEQATTEGIIRGLEWLVHGIKPGDVIGGHFSMHGSYVSDLNKDETDHYDEIICPYDVSWNKKLYVTDDDFHRYITETLPEGVRVDMLFDSCHSGTVTRSPIMNPIRDLRPDVKQRFLPPPINHRNRADTSIAFREEVVPLGRSLVKAIEEVYVDVLQENCTWSACRANQTAVEARMGNKIRGAFTYKFTETWREFKGNMTREALFSTMKFRMRNEGYEQIPELIVPNLEAAQLFPFRKANQIDRLSEVRQSKEQ